MMYVYDYDVPPRRGRAATNSMQLGHLQFRELGPRDALYRTSSGGIRCLSRVLGWVWSLDLPTNAHTRHFNNVVPKPNPE